MPSPGAIQVENPNEVFIGDTYFRSSGPVKVLNITVPPNPVVFGDSARRGDTQAMSEQIQSSNVGGSGIYHADSRTETDRFWISQCETRFKDSVTLPPKTTSLGKPGAITTEDLELTWAYRNEQYFAWANKVYRWLDTTSTWSSLETTLTSPPTDAIVFNNTLYVAYGSGYATRDSAGVWTNVGSTPTSYFVIWDSRLWRIAQVSNLWTIYNLPIGGAWSAAAGQIPSDVTVTQMIVYRDATGASIIYAVTNEGLWAYDATNSRFIQTEIVIPRTADVPRATVFHDGKMYLSTGGLGALSIQSGSQFIATPIGLDLGDGVPTDQAGKIVQVESDFNWILALVDNTSVSGSQTTETGLGPPFEIHSWSTSSGRTVLKAYNGGWHQLWESPSADTPGQTLDVSSAYSDLRVYWGAGGQAYYQNLQIGVHNPRVNTTKKYQAGPLTHTTSWYDFGSDTQEKIHGHLLVRASSMSSTEKITVYYGLDYSETWNLLGEITTNGLKTFLVGGATGLAGTYFRYRFDLQRGADETKRPILEFWSAQFMRVLPATYGFSVELDLSTDYKGQTPSQMLAAIQRLADHRQTPTMIKFSYMDQLDPTSKTFYARISRIAGQEWGGTERRGESRYQVALIAPYTEDAITN